MSKLHDSQSDSHAPASDDAALIGIAAGGAERQFADAADADPLSDVLRSVRLTGALFFLWDVAWPYTTAVPDGRAFAPMILPSAQQIISYHIVTQGCCWAGMSGEPTLELQAGDILLIPHGDAYIMSSSASDCSKHDLEFESALAFFRQMAAGELPFAVADGGAGPAMTRVVCGFLGCDVRPFNPLLAALPRIVRVRSPGDRVRDRLLSLVDYTLAETQQPRPGSRSVLLRLGELLFIEVVRRCLATLPVAQTGWLAGLRDPTVGRALMLLHRKPAQAWTLERLAEDAGLSRSRLAECFTEIVGQPPMQYLTQWRMQLAARMLTDGSIKVSAAARDVGYDSEAAFSRAFKRFVGVSPTAWRRSAARATDAQE